MKHEQHSGDVPSAVAAKLRAIRRRAVAVGLLRGLALTFAALIGSTLAALLVDWAVGWFSPIGRYGMTALVLISTAATAYFGCLRPLFQRRSIVATAREVDQLLPQLEERWSTVTELAQNQDSAEVRGSETLIRQVAREAESTQRAVLESAIAPMTPVWRAARWLGGAMAALAVLFAVNFSQAGLLFRRLLLPGQDISLTQVTAQPADGWVPKGEPLTLSAVLKGRIPSTAPILFLRPAGESVRAVAMHPRAQTAGAFDFAIEEVAGSFEYRVRAGDGQTRWHRITAAERPRITEVQLKVAPPAYCALPILQTNVLPPAIRVLQGSDVEIALRADQPVERMFLDLGEGRILPLTRGSDDWYRIQAQPTNSFSFAAAVVNQFKIDNRNKPACAINVFEDLPPSVRVLEPSDDVAVAPGEKVEIHFEAKDDFGIAKAEVLVNTTTASGVTNAITLPVDLASDTGKKQVTKSVQLDLAELGLKHGDQISYVVQVTDTRQSRGQASPDSGLAPKSEPEMAASQPPGEKSNPESPAAEASDNADAKQQAASANESKASASPRLASTSAKPSDSKPNAGASPPPDEMTRRTLDAGQCSTCKPMNISVDQWAGTFDGEKRKKLEIAIEPILQQLEALLSEAQTHADALKKAAAEPRGLQSIHAPHLATAREKIADSIRVIGDLGSRTAGTPYAFIGLQLRNIQQAHIQPAEQEAAQLTLAGKVEAPNDIEHSGKAVFHLARAREMLADLTRTYETVKRDQQIADAMQRLSKMHQVFLEDTQALLGSAKGPINTYQRKVAEVDDAYVEKLRALLEEKKKVMAELAKLLAEDPRLLRRYLAMQQLQSTTYRDQLTLLAERQKVVAAQIAGWNQTPKEPAARSAFIESLRPALAIRQREILAQATQLRENLEIWLPLDVKPDAPAAKSALTQAEQVIEWTAQPVASQPNGDPPAAKALAALHSLRDLIPTFSQVATTNSEKMAAFIGNRLPEIEALITAQSGTLKIEESLRTGDFPKAAEVLQHQLTVDTVTLGEKLEATRDQVASMSSEISEKANAVVATVNDRIIAPQQLTVNRLAETKTEEASTQLATVVPAFADAEKALDELIRMIIEKLDQAPPPGAPGQNQGTEDLLAMLQDEMKAAESLGIPCRPINVSIMRDWMRPSASQNPGMARAQANQARAQAQQSKAQSDRLQRQARDSAKRALADAKRQGEGNASRSDGEAKSRGPAWNKLASTLDKDLLQGRDNTPPEQYRDAIESYFRTLSGVASDGSR
ncbi:MAG: hypothetical protein JNK85_02165 [Verrucomicrobiales bacterium]|nr:hypothetical protein [Verrucomicrobiales bacterium]